MCNSYSAQFFQAHFIIVIQERINTGHQFHRATKFCTVAPNICGFWWWNWLHISHLVSRILVCLLCLCKFVQSCRNIIKVHNEPENCQNSCCVTLYTFSFVDANVLLGAVFSNTALLAIPLRTCGLWQYLKTEVHENCISTSILTSQKNSASPLQRSTSECFTEKQSLFFLSRVRHVSALCKENTEFLLVK
jgi:hypothetical protein